jgi:hypothetical protein
MSFEGLAYFTFIGLVVLGALLFGIHSIWETSYSRATYNKGRHHRIDGEYEVPEPGLETFWYNLGQARQARHDTKFEAHEVKQIKLAKKKGWLS